MKTWQGIVLASFLAIAGIFLLTQNTKTKPNKNFENLSNAPAQIKDQTLENFELESTGAEINLDDPNLPQEVKQFLQYEDLHKSITNYFDSHSTISADEKTLAAKKIYIEIETLETRNEIIPLEALSLKLALLKTTTRESEYSALAEELTKEYQERISAEAPEIDHEKNANYKQREREVLLEVQAMSQYPDGMSQSEYLRHRLQLLRTEVFEGSN